MRTHDLGRLYWTVTNILAGDGPIFQRGWTAEVVEPFRQGTCVVLHIPRTRYGLGVGWWGAGNEKATDQRLGLRPLVHGDLVGLNIVDLEDEEVDV